MGGDDGIVCRPRPCWPQTVAMFVAFGFAWLMGWGLSVACLAGVAVNAIVSAIVALVTSRRPGRWTE